ncbi:MAG: hypothetical protein ABI832_19645 [bacterium]
MAKVTVTVDRSANLKELRVLEAARLIEIHVVAIEGFQDTRNLPRKELPGAIINSRFAVIGRSSIVRSDTKYAEIQRIVGKQNHGDCIHLERHIASGRKFFITDDNDFLSCRGELHRLFGVTILTVAELATRLASKSP